MMARIALLVAARYAVEPVMRMVVCADAMWTAVRAKKLAKMTNLEDFTLC